MYRNYNYRIVAEKLIKECKDRDVGIQTIKMIARGGWGNANKDCSTWYDPYRTQNEIDEALWWQLSQSIHTAPTCGEFSLLGKVLDSANRFENLSKEKQEEIVLSRQSFHPEPKLAIL
jgi:hypothetical protein